MLSNVSVPTPLRLEKKFVRAASAFGCQEVTYVNASTFNLDCASEPISSSKDFKIAFWFKVPATNVTGTIVQKVDLVGWRVEFKIGELVVTAVNQTTSLGTFITGTTIVANKWYGVEIDVVNGMLKAVWVNKQAQTVVPATIPAAPVTAPLVIGPLAGLTMDELYLYR